MKRKRQPRIDRQGKSKRKKRNSTELIREERNRIVQKLVMLRNKPFKNMMPSENATKKSRFVIEYESRRV